MNEQESEQSDIRVVTRDSTAIHSSRSKISFDISKIDEDENQCIKEFYKLNLNPPIDQLDDEELEGQHSRFHEPIYESSTIIRSDRHRNSFDDSAIETRIKELEESYGFLDTENDADLCGDLIQIGDNKKSHSRRSESTENLISIFTTNNSKTNTLNNIKMLLNHESHHLCLLTTIQQYKYILIQSKVSDEIVWHIFYNISDLIYAQKSLVTYLESMATEFDNHLVKFSEILDLYTLLHVKCKEYVKNVPTALIELKSLFEKNPNFRKAINEINYEGKSMCLDALIAKPINWLCNSLELIKNLIDCTDEEQDRQKLEETLRNLQSNEDESKKSNKNSLETNSFLRSSLFVEQLPYDVRKLRHVFLFSGMIVCAKQKLQTDCNHQTKNVLGPENEEKSSKQIPDVKSIEKFDVKWFISLKNLVLHLSKTIESNDRRKNEITTLKDKIRDLKLQLIAEKSKLNSTDNSAFRKLKIKSVIDRFCNQIFKIQTELLLISPTTEFVISNGPDKPHTLLLPSVKDLEIWKCDILKVQREHKPIDNPYMSITAVNNFLESYRRYSSIVEVATSSLFHDDGVSGVLVTNIFKVDGLNPDFRYYLSIEVDSFNLNELKARTKVCTGSSSLQWNESFDIDLDCSQMMNILVYEIKNYGENKESLIGYFEFQLNPKDHLNQHITKTVSMLSNESAKLTLEASLKYEAKNELLKRQPSIMKTGLFGFSLKSVVTREKKGNVLVENVPMIIVACFKRIEDSGLDEEGIYRISGSKNEINELYKKLNKNPSYAISNLYTYDLHTITGIVKMYLRELPEPLLMTNNYERILQIAKLEEEVERFSRYNEVILSLPEPNHSTVIFVLKHFQKVMAHSTKNQMIAGNLGLILGPTLIMPPCDPNKQGMNNSNIAFETVHSMLLARAFTQILIGVNKAAISLEKMIGHSFL